MVWWINHQTRSSDVSRSGALSCYEYQDECEDVIFQTTNIMFNFDNIMYEAEGIYTLVCSGVNIFNIDRTLHDNDFYKKIMNTIIESDNLPIMFHPAYNRPACIAITMSVKAVIDIDNEVDIIILKEIGTVAEFVELKKQNPKLNDKTVMVWLTKWTLESIYIIKFSDGVVLDLDDENRYLDEFCTCPINLCKENIKPVFCVKNKILKEYYQLNDRDRLLNVMANEIVKNRLDGIVIVDSVVDEYPPKEIIRSLVRAIAFAEKDVDLSKDYFSNSFKTKMPMLPPLSTAFGASLAALKSEAKVILVLSVTGVSSRLVSFTSPPCHVVCITTRKKTARRLHLYRKVIPLFYKKWQCFSSLLPKFIGDSTAYHNIDYLFVCYMVKKYIREQREVTIAQQHNYTKSSEPLYELAAGVSESYTFWHDFRFEDRFVGVWSQISGGSSL